VWVVRQCGSSLVDSRQRPDVSSVNDGRVERALQIIDARYREPRLTISEVAAQTRLSRWHVSRLLKRHTGRGFVAHILHRRVDAAKQLLIDTSLSVKEIAAAVGFGNPCQFSRQFKQLCGIPPVTFRRTPLGTPKNDKRSHEFSIDCD
jgi:transcriptional regulator GlxA family with amidase domain